jgi:hypothetical protein
MRALLIPCLAFCSLALSGCHVAYSVHPLANNEDAVDEPALVGQWAGTDGSNARLCIQKADASTYTMVVSESDPKSDKDPKLVEAYQVTLVRLDDQLFADIVAKGQAVNGTDIDPPAGALYHHVIVKLDLTDSDVRYTVLDPAAIREANQQGYAPLGFIEIDDGILLTAPTEELRWAVSHYSDLLFKESDQFTRVTETAADEAPSPCSAIPPS